MLAIGMCCKIGAVLVEQQVEVERRRGSQPRLESLTCSDCLDHGGSDEEFLEGGAGQEPLSRWELEVSLRSGGADPPEIRLRQGMRSPSTSSKTRTSPVQQPDWRQTYRAQQRQLRGSRRQSLQPTALDPDPGASLLCSAALPPVARGEVPELQSAAKAALKPVLGAARAQEPEIFPALGRLQDALNPSLAASLSLSD